MVSFDGLVEILEGVDGLLENLDYGDAAYIFDRFAVHFFERLHVAFHELRAFATKSAQDKDGVCDRHKCGKAKSPIKNEHHYKRYNRDKDGA